MDIKSSRERYPLICGTEIDISKIEESIKIISLLNDYEFRTTVVGRYHNEQEILNLIQWVKGIIHSKIKRFALQGFKKEEKMIDESFLNEENVNESYLLKLKELIKNDCEEILIRV